MLPHKTCTGCLACIHVCTAGCIHLRADKNGFQYPEIDKGKCIQCKRCEVVCPVLQEQDHDENEESLPVAVAGYIRDQATREQSSSGGIFTALARQVLKRQGVVYGAAFGDNLMVSHFAVQSEDELWRLRGSKYVQSDLSGCYKEIERYLRDGREVLFSGTPCQCAGLAACLGRSYDNLLVVDIICHGVPSPRVWNEYLHWQETRHHSRPVRANFRDKSSGWERFSLSLKFENGAVYSDTLDRDCYMRAFLKNYTLRDSCYQCRFKTVHRISDLTLGDLWGIDQIAPQLNDNGGVSVIFIQSEKGKRFLDALQNHLCLETVDSKMVVECNEAMNHCVYRQAYRNFFYWALGKMDFEKLVDEVMNPKVPTKIMRRLLRLIGDE